MSADSEVPSWFAKQSTLGTDWVPLPQPLANEDELAYVLPDPPTTANEAVMVMRLLRTPGILPHSDAYALWCRNRLVHEVLTLILQCLDVWSADPSNKAAALYTWQGKMLRNFQISPLAIIFKDVKERNDSHVPDVTLPPAVFIAKENEKIASGNVRSSIKGHRRQAANLYLVSAKNDSAAREQHENRGANHDLHEVAVLFTADSDHVYIYDPWFNINDWSGEIKHLADLPTMGRVEELLYELKNTQRESELEDAQITIGGGGLEEGDDCRAMCIKWMVEVVCTQWMGLDGPIDVLADHPPPSFDMSCDEARILWEPAHPRRT